MSRVTGLRERWNDLIPGAAELADDLVERYCAPGRKAFRDQYLQRVLDALGTLDQLSADPTAVYLAAWFHQAVHTPGDHTVADAEASAELAAEKLPAYGVTAARTAEVARLVLLTGARPPVDPDSAPDPNADVLLDAVNATMADPEYAVQAAELRRDSDDRGTTVKQRHALVGALLERPIYRTQLARDRFDVKARANLKREFAVLDGEIPAPWRGWQRAALIGVVLIGPLLAALASFGALDIPWEASARTNSGPPGLPVLLCVVALGTIPLLYRFARRNGRPAKVVTGAVTAAAAVALLIAVLRIPATTPSNGPGGRVPLVVFALTLLVLSGIAAFVSASLGGPVPTADRGPVLAGVAAAVVIVLLAVFVAEPVGRSYLLQSNERITGSAGSEAPAPRSELDGRIAWVSPSTSLRAEAVSTAVATRYGIAISRQTGTIEMLDPATGEVRWKHTRSDVDVRPKLAATGDGRLLLVNFDRLGYLLLDASTGRRAPGRWPRDRDNTLEYADPLLTGEQVSKGSDKLRGVNEKGGTRWTFEPGRCTTISAAATTDTAVAFLNHSCGKQPDEAVGLDLKTGKELWRRSNQWSDGDQLTIDGLLIGLESPSEGQHTVTGVEARTGEVKWRWDVPEAWACGSRLARAGRQVVLLDCPSKAAQRTAVVATVLDGETGRMAWQRTVTAQFGIRSKITADGRVVSLTDARGDCVLTVLSESGQRQVTLPEDVVCARGLQTIGNQVLVSGPDTIIALR
ncbi:PQQ-binding-like beta-propeller repeat protein [Kribbella lupini]|uniref:Pyrrolo-quinoline quinone repeat domain-containing protein n=1 Tax=Kribbella lupini TaxID=291602 RepID=A0ABP4M875_9ACTN